MKTAKEILEESLSYMNCEGIIGENTRLERVVLYAMEEYRSQLTESKELPGDEQCDEIAFRRLLLTNRDSESELQDRMLVVDGLQMMRSIASPIIASRDARIRELEEWISVEVRLPEKEKNVLVLRSNPNVVVCGYIHERGHWIWSNMRGDTHKEGDLHKITHWKNLPTPPKN